jgi:hypothetical protein
MNKIFGIGLSRTGTTSLGLGLEMLGYKTIHFPIDLFTKQQHSICDQYDALVDLPIPLYYKELDQKYPGSKFILTTRDEVGWLHSMKWLLGEAKIIWRHGPNHTKLNAAMYGTDVYDEAVLLAIYRKYNQEVLTYFKDRNDDFIHLDLNKGELNYEIICRFLNLPVLLDAFPKANEKRDANIWNKIEYFLWLHMPLYKKIRYHFIRIVK